jgi:hypothetical protein
MPDVATKMLLSPVGPQGVLEAATDELTFLSTVGQPHRTRMSSFLTTTDRDEYVRLVRDGAAAYGFAPGPVGAWVLTDRIPPS